MRKTFSVGLVVEGHHFTPGYPLCRMSITSQGVILAPRLIPWVPRFEVPRHEVRLAVFTRDFWGVTTVTFDDKKYRLEGVRVQMPVGAEWARLTLWTLGYQVVSFDKWLAFRPPGQKHGWQPPSDVQSRWWPWRNALSTQKLAAWTTPILPGRRAFPRRPAFDQAR